MEAVYRFVAYGEDIRPEPGVLVLDVGMKTVPGVIDHHHPGAEPECAASLVVKHPDLVLGHDLNPLREVVTHRLPDFDALSAIFLALRLLETRRINPAMERLAAYAKIVDSASLPPSIDLGATPYSILRAMFAGRKGPEEAANEARVGEGLKFMRFLHAKAQEGEDILENRRLFGGIERYERAQKSRGGPYSLPQRRSTQPPDEAQLTPGVRTGLEGRGRAHRPQAELVPAQGMGPSRP